MAKRNASASVKAGTESESQNGLTTVDITIEGEPPLYTARTPHVPDLVGIGPTEGQAFNALADAIRQYRRTHEQQDKPVPWDEAQPKPADKNTIRRQVRGLRPVKTKNP